MSEKMPSSEQKQQIEGPWRKATDHVDDFAGQWYGTLPLSKDGNPDGSKTGQDLYEESYGKDNVAFVDNGKRTDKPEGDIVISPDGDKYFRDHNDEEK